ncbi:hypothetical protein ACFSX9_02045 [Flavobacterium ardleyense]|uniref:Uncharacterized protein n=1 Tax=Flavobacterium ardleyense TaxID=2038737 RepID=A0ABW5Z419_9FLAO
MKYLHRNLNYVSKVIECILFFQNEKVKLYLTALVCRKLLSKLIALENSIPNLKQISTSVFIKPIINKEPCLNKQDHYYVFNNLKVIISALYIQLDDCNTKNKKISITVFHPYKATLGLFTVIHTIVILVIGEIAYKKNIKHIMFKPIPKKTNGLLQLIEIDEFIKYLYASMAYKREKLQTFLGQNH